MNNTKIIWGIVIFFCLIPIQIWALMQPLSTRFITLASTMTSLGQLAALVGTVLLSITFLLSTRTKFIERIFGEIGKAYNTHHLMGTLSFLLLLFHPIFIVLKYAAFSIPAAVSFIIPSSNWAVNFGIFAIVLMILSLLFTFFITLQYNRWKLTHQFLGIAWLSASIHIFLITSDLSRNILLKIYIFTFILIGILSFLYKTVLNGWLKKKNTTNNNNNPKK